MNYAELGFIRVAAVAPEVAIADPEQNAQAIVGHIAELEEAGVQLAVFPELCVTGYTCEDLFFSQDLHRKSRAQLELIAASCHTLTAVVGVPWLLDDGRLLNCAAVLANGEIRGMVPKSAHPNYGEFYDRRWFVPGDDIHQTLINGALIARDQLFTITNLTGRATGNVSFGIEICEDLWAPEPPGIRHCLAGAEIIVNLSASNELIGKTEYRRDLVHMASARGICGYLYASCGPLESTKDLVFGGHLLIAENGVTIAEGERFSLAAQTLVTELDLTKLRHDRMQNTTFTNAKRPVDYARATINGSGEPLAQLQRTIDAQPFVPTDEAHLNARATEILHIQATGLARRMLAAGSSTLTIGLSGGLDSTLAFLVCLDTAAKLQYPTTAIAAITMPGPGTSEHTRTSAHELCSATGVPLQEIPINAAIAQHLKDLGHEDETDVVFENAQARERTQILFNYANKVGGIVVGTGDLSELALGWCTYNADHMASYNVNASVPKTMVAYLVRWYAQHRAQDALASVLERVLNTPISPELLAPKDGAISQETEAIIGPYELHDFFLYHFVRTGAGMTKIFELGKLAFAGKYEPAELQRWMKVFFGRFFSQQFKRTTLPPGPKVGTVSLSPRGDWRMPDEASAAALLADIDELLTGQAR